MIQLYKYYELLKEEYKSTKYLISCDDMYHKSQDKEDISLCLKTLGFNCSEKQESILFFSLVDIVAVVDNDNNFYLATMCENKLLELKQSGRLVPKKGETNYNRSISLVESLNTDVINSNLANGKLHLLRLDRLDCKSFLCSISSKNQCIDSGEFRFYPLDIMQTVLNSLNASLSRGIYSVNGIVCSLIPQSSAISCRLSVKTIDGLFAEIYLWDINDISEYVLSETEENLISGVCVFEDCYYTLNKGIIERFYGSSYLEYESKEVIERYCLEELHNCNSGADIRYYIKRYNFYKDEKICECKSVYELQELLRSRLHDLPVYTGVLNARLLTSKRALATTGVHYYSKFSTDMKLKKVLDIDSIVPQTYKVSGVCSLGYCYTEVKATSWESAELLGQKKLTRQYGRLLDNKVLGIQRGNETRGDRHRVYDISLDTQHEIAELISWGYVEQFDNYAKLVRSITDTLKLDYFVSDDMIKFLLINNIAKRVGKCRNITVSSLGIELEIFVNFLANFSKDDIDKLVKSKHK